MNANRIADIGKKRLERTGSRARTPCEARALLRRRAEDCPPYLEHHSVRRRARRKILFLSILEIRRK